MNTYIITYLDENNNPEAIKLQRHDFMMAIEFIKNLKYLEVSRVLSVIEIDDAQW